MELKAEFEPLAEREKEVLGDAAQAAVLRARRIRPACWRPRSAHGGSASRERIANGQALDGDSMASYLAPEKSMEVKSERPITSEHEKKASADKTGTTAKDFIGLPFDAPPLNSGFNRGEPAQFAGRAHRVIKLGQSRHRRVRGEGQL